MMYYTELSLPAWPAVAALACICIVTVLAAFSHVYQDTLVQRAAMAILCLFAFVRAGMVLDAQAVPAEEGLIYIALATYAAATVHKHWRRWRRAGRPGHPLRRSTDWGDMPSGMSSMPVHDSMHPSARAAHMAQVMELHAPQADDRRRNRQVGQ